MSNDLIKSIKIKLDSMSVDELQEVADRVTSMNIRGPSVDDYLDALANDQVLDYDDWEDERNYRWEVQEEEREQELQQLANECTCGAWERSKNGEVFHVADCCCGAQ